MLRAPFPYFGGKSRVAHLVWEALGDPDVFVEPFFGSGAVTLARPHTPRREIVNDRDGFIANFWRAIKLDPAAVARHADWPSNETDKLARHRWLCEHKRKSRFLSRMECDPEYFDAKIAGYWVWVFSQWIGGGCGDGNWHAEGDERNRGYGINRSKLPRLVPSGVVSRTRLGRLQPLFEALSNRLRSVIVACGDWHRVTGNFGLPKRKGCATFLDPPYDHGAERCDDLYRVEKSTTADVQAWCREFGDRKNLRIALAGLEGEYDLPGWKVVKWTRVLGYTKTEQGLRNLERERLWFSPHCQIGPHIRAAIRTGRRSRASLSAAWKPNPRKRRRSAAAKKPER